MALKVQPPRVNAISFNCPRCGAFAHQDWYQLTADSVGNDSTPTVWDEERLQKILQAQKEFPKEKRAPEEVIDYFRKAAAGDVVLAQDRNTHYTRPVSNLFLSECFSCHQVTLWVHSKILWPPQHEGPPPNEDLPPSILADYNEAGTILSLSPRGSAALLRLAIQKLCIHLKQEGQDLNRDIGALVKLGLDPRVQRALDIVRVIGNEAVHPGQIDLKDDSATALELFRLVNLIAEIMISQPAHIERMYDALPESKRRAIEQRDRT